MAAGRRARPLVRIFVGPSIPAAEVRAAFVSVEAELRLLPPAQQGDLLRLSTEQPDVVGIVDGYFFQVPSLLHREILLALEQGTRVLGAASLGALRAAELDSFGMEGVGEVYRWYRDGAIDGDDEVAVSHAGAADGFVPTTGALVNVRHALREARRRDILDARAAEAVLRAARQVHFSARTYPALLDAPEVRAALPAERLDGLRRFLRSDTVDLKRADALLLARTIARRIEGAEPWPPRPAIHVNQTGQLERFQREYVGYPVGGVHVRTAQVVGLHRLLSPSYPALHRRVAVRCLAVEEAAQRGLESRDEAVLLAEFRQAQALASDDAFERWLTRRYQAPDELLETLRALDLEAQLAAEYRAGDPSLAQPETFRGRLLADLAARYGVTEAALLTPLLMRPGVPWERPFVRELKLRGRFGPALRVASRIVRANAEIEATRPNLAPAQVDRAAVEDWLAARWKLEPTALRAASQARGFPYYSHCLEAARQLYVYERHAGRADASG